MLPRKAILVLIHERPVVDDVRLIRPYPVLPFDSTLPSHPRRLAFKLCTPHPFTRMGTPTAPPEPSQVQIRLKAQVSDPALRTAHDVSLAVPDTVGRKGLRALLQHLLPDAPSPLPDFHFLAYEEPLRTTLANFIARRSLSHEKTVPVTYYLPLPAPTAGGSQRLSSKWLSSLSAMRGESETMLLAGSYSGSVSIATPTATVLAEADLASVAHAGAVKAACWLPDKRHFLTASTDETACLWSFSAPDGSATRLATFRSEEAGTAVSFASAAVSADPDAPAGALGGADGSVWVLADLLGAGGDAGPAGAGEKRKAPDGRGLRAERVGVGGAGLATSGVAWRDARVVSVGWDGLAREWDVERGQAALTVPCGGRAATGLAAARDCAAVSAVDGGVRVVDARDGKGVVGACGRRGAHAGVATGVRWVEEGRSAVSGGVDGTVRLWDLRALVAPVHVVGGVHGEGGRSLAVDAAAEGGGRVGVFSAGSDGKVAVHYAGDGVVQTPLEESDAVASAPSRQ